MNKSELINQVYEQTGCSKKDCSKIIETALELMQTSIASGERVTLSGFGSFTVRDRASRIVRNFSTGQSHLSQPGKTVAFRAGVQLQEKLKG